MCSETVPDSQACCWFSVVTVGNVYEALFFFTVDVCGLDHWALNLSCVKSCWAQDQCLANYLQNAILPATYYYSDIFVSILLFV